MVVLPGERTSCIHCSISGYRHLTADAVRLRAAKCIEESSIGLGVAIDTRLDVVLESLSSLVSRWHTVITVREDPRDI